MTQSKPPTLAVKLMQEAGTDPAVIGDLVETYATGRSAGWFWRQAIAASAPSPINALRWAAAIPLAHYASFFLQREVSGLAWAMLRPSSFLDWRSTLPMCVSAFVMRSMASQ